MPTDPTENMSGKDAWAYAKAQQLIRRCQVSGDTKLDLSRRELITIPPEIGELCQLTELNLCGNQLRTLPQEMGRLIKLEILNFADNALTELPPAMEEFKNLRELFLHGNDSLGIPTELLGEVWEKRFSKGSTVANARAILDYYFRKQPAASSAGQVPASTSSSVSDEKLLIYDVFISAKSEDYGFARQVAATLVTAGLRVFFSEQALTEMGNSDYFDAIDTALEGSRHMIVVTSAKQHVASMWVKKEWQTYLNEKLSGRKYGNLVSLLCGSMTIGDLPLSLRQHEARRFEDLATLFNYFKS